MTTPLETIRFNTHPYQHNLFHAAAIPGAQACFSGDWLVHNQQWGAYAINVTKQNWTPSGGMVSPVTDQGPNFQPAAYCECSGDFHQSSQFIVATPNTPRWVITTIPNLGAFGSCSGGRVPAKVQVYKLDDAAGLRFHGSVFGVFAGGSSHRLDGDVGYIDNGNGTWAVVNLLTLTSLADTTNPPAFTPQPDIQGFSFALSQQGPKDFTLTRVGGTQPVLPTYCPNDYVTRKQMAVFLLKVKHGSDYVPPPATGAVFVDVPASDPFAPWIEQLAAEKITGGKGGCEK